MNWGTASEKEKMEKTSKIGKSLVLSMVLVVLLATAGLVFAAGNQAQEEGALWQLWDLAPATQDVGNAPVDEPQGNTEEQPEHLFLWQKCPEGEPCPWVDSEELGAAWGRLVYFSADNPNDEFAFSGYKLDPNTEYELINFGTLASVQCMGTGTTDSEGYVNIKGVMPYPLWVDENDGPDEGAKIRLVLSSDVDCDNSKMTDWNPEEYLFENNLIEDDSKDLSYTMYHGNGIWSTTHIMREDDIKTDDVPAKAQTQGLTCYKLMGVAWPNTPDYTIDPANDDIDGYVINTIETSLRTWDAGTYFDLVGSHVDPEEDITWGVNDGYNFYSFGDYPTEGVIAVTRTWWNIYGEIIEYDIMFDIDWPWGDADSNEDGIVDDNTVMDLQNIATHEIGHGIGLLDLYGRPCSDVTMYGRSNYGDITKRDLAEPDIAGLQLIYEGV